MEEDDDAAGGGEAIGADRCQDVGVITQRRCVENAAKRIERRTVFPFLFTISSSTQASSAFTASLFGSSLSAF